MRAFALAPIVFLSACGASTIAEIQESILQDPVNVVRATAQATAAPTLPPAPATSDDVAFAALMNNVRIGAGVAAISYDGRLDRAAQSYAEEMLASGRFDHIGADGSTVGTRATAQGYAWTFIAENIAQGQQTQTEVLGDWQGSTGHRANNLDPLVEDFGIGVAGAGDERRWVLVLGAE